MSIRITAPDILRASVQLPASKSISNRVLIINALSSKKSFLENLSDCDDTQVMVRALNENKNLVDVLAAGTAMRFLTAYFSITEGERIITGTGRMKQRPVSILVDALRELGADITYVEKEGFPPLHIIGKKLSSKELTLKGDVSSQYISALLLIAPLLDKGLTLCLEGEIISRPYINLTLNLMKEFGVEGEWVSENTIRILPRHYQSVRFTVENDWSAASYWYEVVALAKNAEIELTGLYAKSAQGDSKVSGLFNHLGVETTFTDRGIRLSKTGTCINKLEYDFTEQPDLVQTFAVTCALSGIPFRFHGLQSLRIKETDRIAALITELGKLGFVIKEQRNSVLYWDGERKEAISQASIDTYEDHRMAMAFAPTCLKLPEIKINHPEVVSKSYPRFWEDLHSAGFVLEKDAPKIL